MRIVSGKYRGRTIHVPDTRDTRPTMDRTRESVFNILRSAAWAMASNGDPVLYDAFVLDVFAGSGAMGLEALSQGAQHVTFFENSKIALPVIRKNIESFGVKADVVAGDIRKIPANRQAPATLAFLDPPYEQGLVDIALEKMRVSNWIDEQTLLVIETSKKEEIQGVSLLDVRQYGMAKISFARLA